MLANYHHINKVDIKTFYEKYGRKIIDFQQFFIAPIPKNEIQNVRDYYQELVINGIITEKIFIDVVMSIYCKPKNENQIEAPNDGFFESV